MNLPKDFVFTQSNLQDYLDCPYRFFLRYIRQTRWPALVADDAVAFEARGQIGAQFHRLIQQYLLEVPEERLSEIAESDPSPEVNLWWQDFLLNVPPWLEGERWVETTLSTLLAGHRLAAKFDLVLAQAPGSLMIYDWKTSQKRPREEWLLGRAQTRLYRFLLAEAGSILYAGAMLDPAHIIMHYWYAPHPTSPIALPYDAESYESDRQYFDQLTNEIHSREPDAFTKTPDIKHCRFCVYRSHCDRGTHAGDLSDFEDDAFDLEDNLQDIDFDEIAEITF